MGVAGRPVTDLGHAVTVTCDRMRFGVCRRCTYYVGLGILLHCCAVDTHQGVCMVTVNGVFGHEKQHVLSVVVSELCLQLQYLRPVS